MVPASIDNDIPGTEISIGVDTALNEIVRCVDKLIATSSAVNRVFVVETMGRNCGYLAIFGALASAPEQVFSPEQPISNAALEELLRDLQREYNQGRRYAAIVVGEGAAPDSSPTGYIESYILIGRAETRATQAETLPWDVRKSVLGHLQRGGPASAFDRILATRMGAKAVQILARSEISDRPQMVTLQGGLIETISLAEVITKLDKGETGATRERLAEIAKLVRDLSRMPKDDRVTGAVAILTAGYDAQGMNMILRGASRYARNKHGLVTYGFRNGYSGLIKGDRIELTWQIVSAASAAVVHTSEGDVGAPRMPSRRAGSILGVELRLQPFTDAEKQAILKNLKSLSNLRGLIVVGDLATAFSAAQLDDYFREQQADIPIVFVPATIDHGLPATHATVGFDSALNVITTSCDKIIDTGQAMNRVSIVETMGGRVGALALMGGMAAGAELVLGSEDIHSIEDVQDALKRLEQQMAQWSRDYATIVVKDHLLPGYTIDMLQGSAHTIFSRRAVRKSELGYVQQGGDASYYDRALGTLMGVEAVKALADVTPKGARGSQLLRVFKERIEPVSLRAALAGEHDEGVPGKAQPWTDETRMDNAKPLWRYEELSALFEQISVFAAPDLSRG